MTLEEIIMTTEVAEKVEDFVESTNHLEDHWFLSMLAMILEERSLKTGEDVRWYAKTLNESVNEINDQLGKYQG